MKLKVGMRVKIINNQDGRLTKGCIGTIVRVDDNDPLTYNVKFDTFPDDAIQFTTWWFPRNKLKPLYNTLHIDTNDIVLPTLNY